MNGAGADAAGFDELLDTGLADADQGKFGGGKESVGCDQEQDQKHPQQHKGDHGMANSNIPKELQGRSEGLRGVEYAMDLHLKIRVASEIGPSASVTKSRSISASIFCTERSKAVRQAVQPAGGSVII